MNEWLPLGAVFVSVLIVVFTVLNAITSRRELRRRVQSAQGTDTRRRYTGGRDLDRVLSEENEVMRYYFEVLRKEHPESLRSRLIRAGYFSRNGPFYFNGIRVIVSFAVFVLLWWALVNAFPSVRPLFAILIAMVFSGVAFILGSAVLDRLGRGKEIAYRKLFPDFLDLLIVCVDAGLSIDAAIDRVAREFLVTNPDFGLHLSIISLEVRAGRPLHETLMNFSNRVNLEEARSLAILFRQAVELGTSVGKTLRVFGAEMREMRIVRAEEKANALPIKMLFPLAVFLFPVNLIIVLIPIILTILQTFSNLSTPSF